MIACTTFRPDKGLPGTCHAHVPGRRS